MIDGVHRPGQLLLHPPPCNVLALGDSLGHWDVAHGVQWTWDNVVEVGQDQTERGRGEQEDQQELEHWVYHRTNLSLSDACMLLRLLKIWFKNKCLCHLCHPDQLSIIMTSDKRVTSNHQESFSCREYICNVCWLNDWTIVVYWWRRNNHRVDLILLLSDDDMSCCSRAVSLLLLLTRYSRPELLPPVTRASRNSVPGDMIPGHNHDIITQSAWPPASLNSQCRI